MNSKVFWQASLSNGESFFEGKGDYKETPNQPSPWQRLQKYISENNLKITSLGLYTLQGQTFNLPSSGKNPKFRAFDLASKPENYNFFRIIGQDVTIGGKKTGISDHFAVVEAIYPSYKLQIWVDNNNPKNCWVLVVEK